MRCLKWALIRVTLCPRSAMAGLAPASGVGLPGGRAAPIRVRAECPTTHSLERGPQSRRSGSLHPALSSACLVPDSVAFVLLDSCENSQGSRARCCEDSFFPDWACRPQVGMGARGVTCPAGSPPSPLPAQPLSPPPSIPARLLVTPTLLVDGAPGSPQEEAACPAALSWPERPCSSLRL